MLWEELTNLCGEVHVSQTFILQAQRLQSTAAQKTYKEAKPSRNRNAVKLCIQNSVSMLAVASRCRFIYIQPCMRACGEEHGKPTEAVNSSDGEPETGDIQAATKLAGKNPNGRSLDLTVRRLYAASVGSRCKAVLSKCPRGAERICRLPL